MNHAQSDTAVVTVGGDQPYDVHIGYGLRGQIARRLCELFATDQGDLPRIGLVYTHPLAFGALEVTMQLTQVGFEVAPIEIPAAEAGKTVAVLEQAWGKLGQAGFTRTDVILTYGGGATTDVGGFIAASWLRGVAVVHLPTTLLGMVDAAVGGKTGINTPEGKNLVGAFHPPAAVLCDLDTLGTLPVADVAAGLAEVVKAGFISDARILELVQQDPAAALDWKSPVVHELITRGIAVKAAVVSGDLREQAASPAGRIMLNYGHTFGHAIEKAEQYQWRHGDAVSVGMVFAAHLAHRRGLLTAAEVQLHEQVLQSLGLPIRYEGARWEQLRETMQVDKKVRGQSLRMVLLDGIGQPTIVTNPPEAELAYAAEQVMVPASE